MPTASGSHAEVGAGIGTQIRITTDGAVQVIIRDGANGTPLFATSSGTVNLNAWNIIGVTIDEATGAGAGIFNINGAGETFDATYSGPSAGAATYTMEIASAGDAGSQNIAPNDTRMAVFALWSGAALTEADFDAIFDALGARFGL